MKTETTCPDKIDRALAADGLTQGVDDALFDQREALFGALWATISHMNAGNYDGGDYGGAGSVAGVLVDADRLAALARSIRAIDDARIALGDAIS